MQRGDCTYTTSVNPRREALPGDPLRPPPEWYLLIAAIRTIPSDSARAVEEAPSPRVNPNALAPALKSRRNFLEVVRTNLRLVRFCS